ncbi:MAG TPA: hypothetical protein VGV90_03735 [Solirubrobacteraceae bacterium]|nr:hypothetical protein [Solirubrobacteraceae bacterium]
MLIALPTFSSGATAKNELRSFDSVQTRVGPADPPATKPPLHGTNAHGQGTAAVVDLTPNPQRPYTVDASGNAADEDIIIGRSRGEQRADGTYHGHITVASAFGNEIIGRDTLPGQSIGTADDPESIAEDLVDNLCASTGICLGIAEVFSRTTDTGSFNTFSLARATLGAPGVPALSLEAARSEGNITSDGTCQTSNGASRVVDLTAGTAEAEIAESTSQSVACRGAAPTQTNTSSVIELGGTSGGLVPVPIPVGAGCADGAPDTETGLPVLLPIVCNADDSSATNPAGNQAVAPADRTLAYGVRHALDVYVLATGNTAAAQISAAQSESLAVSPAAATTTTPTTPTTTTPATTTPAPVATTTTPATTTPATTDDGGTADDDAGAGDDGAVEAGNGDDGARAGTPDDAANLGGDKLPFTGTDVVVLGLAGSILLAAGLTLRGPARRREFDN